MREGLWCNGGGRFVCDQRIMGSSEDVVIGFFRIFSSTSCGRRAWSPLNKPCCLDQAYDVACHHLSLFCCVMVLMIFARREGLGITLIAALEGIRSQFQESALLLNRESKVHSHEH